MVNYNLAQIFDIDYEYKIINCLYQRWFDESFSYMERPRPNCGILFVVDGKIEFKTEQGTITAIGGDILFMPKNSRYNAIFKKGVGTVYNYLINFEISKTDMDLESLYPQKIMSNADTKFINLFENLTKNYLENTNPNFRLKADFYILISEIINRAHSANSTQHEIFSDIEKDLVNTELPVSEIAKKYGVSQSGLRNSFAKEFGAPPKKYRMLKKINKAKYLLQSTDMNNREITDALNFFDEAYFCKIFNKYVGCSPKNYKRNKSL